MNLPARNLQQINDYRRRVAQTLDYIAQYRLRAQVAESYGLYAVAERARGSIARLELDLDRYNSALAELREA